MTGEILKTVSNLAENLQHVVINREAIEEFAQHRHFDESNDAPDYIHLFAKKWNRQEALMLLFIFNSMNFCFWSEKDQPRWEIYHNGEKINGSMGLLYRLEELAAADTKFLVPEQLQKLSFVQFKEYLTGIKIELPLLAERYRNLINIAEVISRDYAGKIENVFNQDSMTADSLLNALINKFESFQDDSHYSNSRIYYWKRAQLTIKMISDYFSEVGTTPISHLETLTAFADYKVPQILRHLGILEYSDELALRIDNYNLIEKESIYENEIRIGNISAIEGIKSVFQSQGMNTTAAEIDILLWNRAAANKDKMKPYHRTYTTAY